MNGISRKIAHFFTEDFVYKIFAFLLAALIWLFVSHQVEQETATYTVPAMLAYDQERMVVEPDRLNLQVMLRGSRGSLERIEARDIDVDLQLPPLEETVSDYEFRISASQIRVPSGVQVEEVRPSRVFLQVDQIEGKEVPVAVQEKGELPAGYRVLRRQASPAAVRIKGPSRRLAGIHRVLTEPVLLGEDARQSFKEQNVPLALPADVEAEPGQVQVEYEISLHTELKSFDELPVRALVEHKSRLKVGSEIPSAGVVLRGPRDVLQKMQKGDVQPFVKIADFASPGEYTVPVEVWLADDKLKVEHLTPRQLELELLEVE